MLTYLLFFCFLLVFSIILNLFFLSIIQLGVFGLSMRVTLINLLDKNVNLIPIFNLFVFILFQIYLSFNFLYLDSSSVTVSATMDNSSFFITGDALKLICDNLGSAGVFCCGARIGAALVSKHSIGILPKTGIIGSIGSGLTISYKIISNSMSTPENAAAAGARIGIKPVTLNIELSNVQQHNSAVDLPSALKNFFGINDGNYNIPFTEKFKNNSIELIGNESSNKVIKALEENNPNWKDSFIHSPLENNQFIIDILSNNLLLQFIVLYLLIMLILIISSKFLLNESSEFKTINSLPFGGVISYLLKKYISIWKKSSNIWILLIVFSIFIFNLVSIYSIYNLLLLLK
uniref:Hyp4 n=1 Tax=Moniliophthora roreri (strain MCA 2997) TaxID=1381753 RepID=F2WVI9_MONRO|nr:hyp4 [Moniliophthora roreri]ADO51587.1 hyp4 [Moniliophthora roreri]